ncbi:translation initiation factor IF-3 [Candidatus Peregrinibacteria bacterium]|nr:translation initiation factor IF-3 [Candidatus Peregrinibacteria bacterium]
MSKKHRLNNGIRVPTVRLIDENDDQAGIKSIEDALKMAADAGLDLVEVAPNAKPPVCKILDYGKHLYRQSKLEKKQKNASKQAEMKGIRITLRIDKHDLETKIKHARKFLEGRHSVKVTLMFKGREAAHRDMGAEKLDLFFNSLQDVAHLEQAPKKQGNQMFMILTPQK